jgi:carbon-monoxide dehydrogenase medium subunit
MKPPPFDYARPANLDEALALLATKENCKLLAGGQSLMAMLNLRFVFPDTLIDLNRISELSELLMIDGRVEIGAMVRQRLLERSPLVAQHLPVMVEALKYVGHRQTRNRGTIGGSICHLDPSAELPTIALLYDAEVEIASSSGRKRLPIRDFLAGYMSVKLAPDEMLTRIWIKPWAPDHSWAFLEHARRRGDFAIASASCLVERDTAARVSRIAIAIGGLTDTPIRLDAAEALLLRTDGGEDLIARASALVKDMPASTDIHADTDYRRHVASVLVKRVLLQAMQGATSEAAI